MNPFHARWLLMLSLGGATVGVFACRTEREPPPPSASTTLPPSLGDTALGPDSLPTVHWNSSAGRGLVLASGMTGDSAMVLRPDYIEGRFNGGSPSDVQPLARTQWDLFGRSGAFGSAALTPGAAPTSSEGCTSWPAATVSTSRTGWRAALETGHATAIPLDSVEAFSPADSARFIIDVTRLASSVRGRDDSLFSSIPFVVRSAYRFRTGDIEGIIASVQRSIHSEANPREEHLFLIAERPVGSTEPFRIAYTTREAGTEGGVPVTDVLAVVMLSAAHRPALVASHEYEDAGGIWWIERVAPRQWRATWRSATTGC